MVKFDDIVLFWKEVEMSKVERVAVLEAVLVMVILGIVEGTDGIMGSDTDKGGEEKGGGGGNEETKGEESKEGKDGAGPRGMRVLAFQNGSIEGASSMVISGRRVDGKELRYSMNVI